MRERPVHLTAAVLGSAVCLLAVTTAWAQEEGLTRDVPIQEFQNRQEDVKPYDFDAKPEGIFYSIQFAEGFEEEMGVRRTHEIIPVRPTDVFAPNKLVFVVFTLYPHMESFQIVGRCYPEHVAGLDSKDALTEDKMHMALEDESGYLKFFPPSGGWRPGKYKVEVHVGWKVTEFSLMGTMRFTVDGNREAADATASKMPWDKEPPAPSPRAHPPIPEPAETRSPAAP
jgi:hypothetical protein